MISVTHTIHDVPELLRDFPPYANGLLRATVKDGIDFGQSAMRGFVPVGQSGKLEGAVQTYGPINLAWGHYLGDVHVDERIAPYADKVNRGTGVDGPWMMPVSVLRPSRTNPQRPGAMKFRKQGETTQIKRVVKMYPSQKIQRGKNFSGRTYSAMNIWTQARTSVLSRELTMYFEK